MARTNPVTGHGYVLVAHTAFEQRGKKRGLCMCYIDLLMLYPLNLPRRSQSKRTGPDQSKVRLWFCHRHSFVRYASGPRNAQGSSL